jgi:hypothetical protein
MMRVRKLRAAARYVFRDHPDVLSRLGSERRARASRKRRRRDPADVTPGAAPSLASSTSAIGPGGGATRKPADATHGRGGGARALRRGRRLSRTLGIA